MSKPVAAGLFLLALATIGVAASQDEQDRKLTAVVVAGDEQPPGNPEAKGVTAEAEAVEIQIGNDGKVFINRPEKKEGEADEDVEIVIQNEDGKIVRKMRSRPNAIRATRAWREAPAIDGETRQALEKMIAGLHEEIKKLQADKKDEEAEKKAQSARALRRLLDPVPPPGGVGFFAHTPESEQARAEMTKLHQHLQDLQAKMSQIPESDKEARARLEQEMTRLKKQMAETHEKLANMARFGGVPGYAPGFPGAPGGAVPPGMLPAPGQPLHWQRPGVAAGSGNFGWVMHSPSPAADEMARKAVALSQAAAKLKEAGLDKQAQELNDQAQKLNSEAEKIRAQGTPGGFAAGGGFGSPLPLHHAIHELQEQIQQLRKEVGELRELLQRRP